MNTTKEGSGSFKLYPINGGVGCRIDIIYYDQPNLAEKALQDIRKTFSSVKDRKDGFEAQSSKAYFSCRVHENHLIKIWYSLPKKEKKHDKEWKHLQNCVTILPSSKSSLMTTLFPDDMDHHPSVVEIPQMGWACYHPQKQLCVIFETWPMLTGKPKERDELSHLIYFHDFKSKGYFYVKWDQPTVQWNQSAASNHEPYHQHLQEMINDLLMLEPNQQFLENPVFNETHGYATLTGTPYDIFTLAEDGFLYGFAVRPTGLMSYDINDLLKKIKWLSSTNEENGN